MVTKPLVGSGELSFLAGKGQKFNNSDTRGAGQSAFNVCNRSYSADHAVAKLNVNILDAASNLFATVFPETNFSFTTDDTFTVEGDSANTAAVKVVVGQGFTKPDANQSRARANGGSSSGSGGGGSDGESIPYSGSGQRQGQLP